MRIHITYTGGTIGMVESPNGLVPGADMRGWLRRLIEDAHLDPSLFSFTELDPLIDSCLLYTSPSPRDRSVSRMPSSA